MYGPLNSFSQELHATKYRGDGESFDDYCVRYARTTAHNERHFRVLLDALRHQRLLPAGRQQLAVGRPHQITGFNCFVAPPIPDSMEGIMEVCKLGALTLRSGGGCGWDFSTIRPEGEPVRGLGLKAYATGPVSFMGIWNSMCQTIKSAGHRRGAMMGMLRVDHPDILKFIHAKRNNGALTNFNVSVLVTDEFMDALERDAAFDLRFDGRVYDRVSATELWATIMESTWDWAEPGVVFIDRINQMNPLNYCETISATNPCFTGDTVVKTAEGDRTLEALATAGEDVLVLSQNTNKELEYKWMRAPRKTRENAALVKVVLDDGTEVRCTPEHEFYLSDGQTKVAAQDLAPGDSLQSVYPRTHNGYVRLKNGHYRRESDGHTAITYSPLEHRLVLEGVLGRRLVGDEICHHEDGDKQNNAPENLRLWNDSDHKTHHALTDNCMLNGKVNFGRERNPRYIHVDVDRVRDLYNSGMTVNKIADELNVSKYVIDKRLKWLRDDGQLRNHRVVRVEELTEREDVYCGTVDDNHNFFVKCQEGYIQVKNCGEQPLPPHGACLLGSINVAKYLTPTMKTTNGNIFERAYDLDYHQMKEDIRAAVWAFDTVIDKTYYPLDEQRREAQAKRRMGLGPTGMANALETMGFAYGTGEYIAKQDEVMKFLRDHAYQASIELAHERGAFELFDADGWLASGFAQTLDDEHRREIRNTGLRNGLLLSIAPTGTISQCADNVSSGIEPPYSLTGTRLVHMPSGQVEVDFEDYAYKYYGVAGVTAQNCTAQAHVDVLCSAQRWVDSAVSKTCNVYGVKEETSGVGVTYHQFKDLYLRAYHGGAKGCTTFNISGKRFGIFKAAEEPTPDEGESCTIDLETGVRTCDA